MTDGKKPVEFSWKWVVPVIIFAARITSDSWIVALGTGACLAFFAFPWLNAPPKQKGESNDENWMLFIFLLLLALVFGGSYKHHANNRENGIEEDFEYDRDRP